MELNYELTNINNKYMYIYIYSRNNVSHVSYHLYKNEVDFFRRLRDNLHIKNYKDGKLNEVLTYRDECLSISFDLHDGGSIFNIADKDFIRHMCDAIVKEGMNLISD